MVAPGCQQRVVLLTTWIAQGAVELVGNENFAKDRIGSIGRRLFAGEATANPGRDEETRFIVSAAESGLMVESTKSAGSAMTRRSRLEPDQAHDCLRAKQPQIPAGTRKRGFRFRSRVGPDG